MEMIIVKTLLSLGAVLALMLGVLYAVRRYVQGSSRTSANRVEVELLGQKTLGPRRSVQVLKVLDRVLVIGISEQGMQALSEFSGEGALRELDARRQELEEARTPTWTTGLAGRVAKNFRAQLRAAMGSRSQVLAHPEDFHA